jgi:hypothetical protein
MHLDNRGFGSLYMAELQSRLSSLQECAEKPSSHHPFFDCASVAASVLIHIQLMNFPTPGTFPGKDGFIPLR